MISYETVLTIISSQHISEDNASILLRISFMYSWLSTSSAVVGPTNQKAACAGARSMVLRMYLAASSCIFSLFEEARILSRAAMEARARPRKRFLASLLRWTALARQRRFVRGLKPPSFRRFLFQSAVQPAEL